MIVIPAIDLRGGRCVRLFRGDFDAVTTYDEDPVEVATSFRVRRGAPAPRRRSRRRGRRGLEPRDREGDHQGVAVPVQLGGGIRSTGAIEAGARGRRRARDPRDRGRRRPGFVAEAVADFGDAIVVAVDVRDDRVMTHGWRSEGPPLDAAIPALDHAGAPRFLLTSISRDGTMDGPDVELYERVLALTDRPVVASGGVRTADDVWMLRDLGVEAAVVGKALYAGTLRMPEVVRG